MLMIVLLEVRALLISVVLAVTSVTLEEEEETVVGGVTTASITELHKYVLSS
jgi:hypothetical protein